MEGELPLSLGTLTSVILIGKSLIISKPNNDGDCHSSPRVCKQSEQYTMPRVPWSAQEVLNIFWFFPFPSNLFEGNEKVLKGAGTKNDKKVF